VQDSDSLRLKKIGKKLQELRMQKKITQKELAFILDVEISQITRIERGVINTSILTILKIAEALEMSASELFQEIKFEKDE
jgi:transcriptional regulator with XRE-family HTH domain